MHLLDYKPDATTNKPFAQLTIYALALSHLTGIPLFDFKCAWFNEHQYCEFFPRTILARHAPAKSKSAPLDRRRSELRDDLRQGTAQQSHFRTTHNICFANQPSEPGGSLHCAFSNLRYTFHITHSRCMTNTLKQAIQRVSELPPAAQEQIGEELLLHVENVRRLRSQLETGADSLDHNGERVLKMADVIQRARAQHDTKSREAERETMRMIEDDSATDVVLTRDLANADLAILRGDGTPQEEVYARSGLQRKPVIS